MLTLTLKDLFNLMPLWIQKLLKNVFVFPELNTGNCCYKAIQRALGDNCLAVGPILQGLNKPVNDLSRGATVKDIINTIAFTAVFAQKKG